MHTPQSLLEEKKTPKFRQRLQPDLNVGFIYTYILALLKRKPKEVPTITSNSSSPILHLDRTVNVSQNGKLEGSDL